MANIMLVLISVDTYYLPVGKRLVDYRLILRDVIDRGNDVAHDYDGRLG